MKIKATLFLFLCFFFSMLISNEVESLHESDIKKIMDQIFSQHIDKKELNSDILKKSFRLYLNQFDPKHIYLLESEVTPYTEMSDKEAIHVIQEYSNNNYELYEKLNDLIQNSIIRAQNYREILLKQNGALLSKEPSIKLLNIYNRQEFDKNYAKNLSELEEKQKSHLLHYILTNSVYPKPVPPNKVIQLIKKYDKLLRHKEAQYLFIEDDGLPMSDSKKENLLSMRIIKSLAKSLDAHTSFLNPNEAYDMKIRLEKMFTGIGVVLVKNNAGFKVMDILPGSPAESNRQIALNDQLIQIDGKDISNESMNSVMEMLRGKNGTMVSLLLKKPEQNTYEITLKRAPIVVNEGRAESSFVRFEDGIIGTIKLQSFYQGINGISSENDIKKVIKDLSKKGPLKGLILDLRENSGGFLNQAVKVAGLFITNGVVVISKYSNGEEKYYRDMDGKVSFTGPLVVLTSKMTASAAEIVAQALQDYGVALVVGDEQTYGKGTIQSQTVTNENTTNSFFKVTVGKYYTVSGKTPQLHGVKADIVVSSPYENNNIGEEYLDYTPLRQDNIPEAFIDNLRDIDPRLRPWYQKNYIPTLQKRNLVWKNYIPQLKIQSKNRLNPRRLVSQPVSEKEMDDPQLHEAINIVKDMVILESTQQKVLQN